YFTKQQPNTKKFCDFKICEDIVTKDGKMLACRHAYHQQYFATIDFKYKKINDELNQTISDNDDDIAIDYLVTTNNIASSSFSNAESSQSRNFSNAESSQSKSFDNIDPSQSNSFGNSWPSQLTNFDNIQSSQSCTKSP
ncbi:27405_t:CDS:2, partial [Racocetra persica]